MNLVITGRPITKKNHGQIVTRGRRPRFLESSQYREYEARAIQELRIQAREKRFAGYVKVTVYYYMRDRRGWPDLIGLMQATADILERAGVIENDRNIVNWGDTCIMGIDKENPRAEITIEKGEAKWLRQREKNTTPTPITRT